MHFLPCSQNSTRVERENGDLMAVMKSTFHLLPTNNHMKTNLLKFTCGFALLGATLTAPAQSILTDTFDGAGFGTIWTGTNNVQGTATLTLSSALSDGTYYWTDLINNGAVLSMNLGTGLSFTQSDLTTESTSLTIIINGGYFAFAGPATGYSGGSADFLNAQNGYVAFSPENWKYQGEYTFGYYMDTTGPSGGGANTISGQYAPQTSVIQPVTPAPEPSTLALGGLGGLAMLWQFRRRK